tara:strand:+ start:9861 stop:10253 length:393 start_codon:yes stop_codon:yes gene_type:complete
MERPKHIRLLGVAIPLIVSHDKPEDPEDEVFGEWDSNEMTITLNSECGEVQERTTVMHELVHAIDDFLYLEMTHQEVYVLSQVLYQVLIDNPKFMDYLMFTPSEDRDRQRNRTDSAGHTQKRNKKYRCGK